MTIIREPDTVDVTRLRSCRIIGIDGDNGAGKSTLANELSQRIGGSVISVDDFLLGNGDAYLSQLNMPNISKAIEAAEEPIIVEGMLLLDVLDRIGLTPDFMIFAKCEFEGPIMYGRQRDICDYYKRRKPAEEAQLIVTLRIKFNMHNEDAAQTPPCLSS